MNCPLVNLFSDHFLVWWGRKHSLGLGLGLNCMMQWFQIQKSGIVDCHSYLALSLRRVLIVICAYTCRFMVMLENLQKLELLNLLSIHFVKGSVRLVLYQQALL